MANLDQFRITADFSPEEKELALAASTDQTVGINQTKIISEIYTARMYRASAFTLSESNKEIADLQIEASKEIAAASEKHASRLTLATWVLAASTIGLLLATIALVFVE